MLSVSFSKEATNDGRQEIHKKLVNYWVAVRSLCEQFCEQQYSTHSCDIGAVRTHSCKQWVSL